MKTTSLEHDTSWSARIRSAVQEFPVVCRSKMHCYIVYKSMTVALFRTFRIIFNVTLIWSSHPFLRSPVLLLLSGFQTKIVESFLIFPALAKWPNRLSFLVLNIIILVDRTNYEATRYAAAYNVPQFPHNSPFSAPHCVQQNENHHTLYSLSYTTAWLTSRRNSPSWVGIKHAW